jgi:V/A-type H+/Na+-transporting ATPase subunit K
MICMALGTDAAIAAVGAGLVMLGGAVGTGMAQSAIGSSGMGLVAEKPEEFGRALLFLVLPESILIFAFVIAILIMLGFGIGI